MSTQHDDSRGRAVVVGTDGSDENTSALRYAAAEAADLGVPLDVVHVVPDYLPISPMMPRTPEDLTQTGAAIVDEAAQRVRALEPTLHVRAWLRHGTRPVQLAQAAEEGQLLVVGRDGRPLPERLYRGDAVTGVAARATVPVVQVPEGWGGRDRGVVLLGVKGPQHASELLSNAFALARRRGATVLVLHAWRLPTVYDDIIEVRVDLESWRDDARSEMEDLLRDWRVAYPDVPVEVRIVHDHAARALIEASASADVVMMVRRAHGYPPATHLGSTARAVLRAADCPVCVVPPTNRPVLPPLPVEESGALVR